LPEILGGGDRLPSVSLLCSPMTVGAKVEAPAPTATPQQRYSRWKLVGVAAAALALSALGLAAVAVKTLTLPAIVPTRVLIDGGRGQKELVATMEAAYHEEASWHTVGVHGGSCEVRSASGPALSAAVLQPLRLGPNRVNIQAVVTELWPMRVRSAIERGGVLECNLAAYVDVFSSGLRVERQLQWSLASSEEATTAVVKPQGAKPRLDNGTLAVDATHIFQARLPPNAALAEFFRTVPVAVRAEFGYAEKREGALQGRISVDAELAVTSEDGTGMVVLELPFMTSASASLPSIARQMVAAGRSDGVATEHAIVFAPAPGAPATAVLFGGEHTVAWSRVVRTREARRLAGIQDLKIVQRLRIDDAELLEVAFAIVGGDPTEVSLHAKTATDGRAWSEVFGVTVRTDNLLEPVFSNADSDTFAGRYVTDFGNFSTSLVGGSELISWTADGMGANLSRSGEDFDLNVQFPDGAAVSLSLKSGDLSGELSKGDSSLANISGTVQKADDSTLKLNLAFDVASESITFVGEAKRAQSWGGSLVGNAAFKNGTEIGSVDAKIEATESWDGSVHFKIQKASAATPAIEAKIDVDATEPLCGRIVATVATEGERQLGVDLGCTRSAVSADFAAHLVLLQNTSSPVVLNTSMDLASKPGFGGGLVVFCDVLEQRILEASVTAEEGAEKRKLDAKVTAGAPPAQTVLGVGMQFSKPGTADVVLDAVVMQAGREVAKVALSGKPLDQVVNTREVAGRRELVVANPGMWNATLSVENAGVWYPAYALGASLAQVGSVVALEVGMPNVMMMALTADSSAPDAIVVDSKVAMIDGQTGTQQTALTIGGKMVHSGDYSSSTMTLAAGSTSQSVDLVVSRGFLPKVGGDYGFNMSATANIAGVGVDVQDARIETHEDWSFAGIGWHVKLRDASGKETFVQEMELALAGPPPPAGATTIAGSMKVEVTGDVAAFVKDPKVKQSFQVGIAEVVGVPASFVTVELSVERRLSEGRRLAGTVTVNYVIAVPESKDASATVSVLKQTTPAQMTTAFAAKMSEMGADYSMTVTESSEPEVKAPEEIATDGASGTGARGAWLAAAACGGLSAV